MMFGRMGNPDHDDSVRIIHRAIDAGINVIDTADVYSGGESEEIVGQAIKGRRDDLVVATKFGMPMGQDPNQRGGSRRWIMTEVENSLRRLGTDHIDLYQMHRPDHETEIGETLSALSDLVQAGKIRAFGSSMFPAELITEAQWAAERRGMHRFVTEQPMYSIFTRKAEAAVLPTAQRYGFGVLTFGPLNSGWLSGRADVATGHRATFRPRDLRPVHPGRPAEVGRPRQAHGAGRRGGPAPASAGHRVRPGPSGRHGRPDRPAHRRAAGRPAVRRRRRALRRHPRPHRRDRPARHRLRPGRHLFRDPACPGAGRPASPVERRR